MRLILQLFTLVTGIFLSLDTVVYPHFVRNLIGIDTTVILYAYIIVALLASVKIRFLPETIIKLNQKFAFPFFAVAFFLLLVLELNKYPNYIYSLVHIDLSFLGLLTLFSGLLAYLFIADYAQRKPLYYIFAPVALAVMYGVVQANPKLFIVIVQEDGLAETLQFLMYIAAAFLAFRAYRHYWKKKRFFYAILFLLFAFGSAFVGFEEISWGQRILGIETPEYFKEMNHQEEITIHNLEIFQHTYLHLSYMAVGLYGAFSRPIIRLLPRFRKYEIFTPPSFLFFCFFSTFSYYFLNDNVLVPNEITVGAVPLVRWQEVFETFTALGFFGYARAILK